MGNSSRQRTAKPSETQKCQMTLQISISRQCQSESFWYRCLPLSLAMSTAVQVAGKFGVLKKYSFGKAFAAGMVGFGLGKLSYVSACEDKFLRELPRSQVSQLIRKRRVYSHWKLILQNRDKLFIKSKL